MYVKRQAISWFSYYVRVCVRTYCKLTLYTDPHRLSWLEVYIYYVRTWIRLLCVNKYSVDVWAKYFAAAPATANVSESSRSCEKKRKFKFCEAAQMSRWSKAKKRPRLRGRLLQLGVRKRKKKNNRKKGFFFVLSGKKLTPSYRGATAVLVLLRSIGTDRSPTNRFVTS